MRKTHDAREKSTGIMGKVKPMIVSEPKIDSARDDFPACYPPDATR
jgi:hypothetical protein